VTETSADMIKAHCNNCGPHRSHTVLKRVERRWDDDEARIDGTDRYLLLECRGCERITLRHDSWNSYETDNDGHSIVTIVYYPPAISRKEPAWLDSADGPFFLEFDSTIRKLLKEIYSALHNDSRALAAMGIRALIEHIMIDRVGESGAIGSNVDRFIQEGFVAPKSEALFREHLIESGHAAMHRGYFPKPSDISALLDIAEGLIETIYVHPHRAKGQKIPPRPKKNT
jgi:Domain of unknown function (DUF4145)